ncbi:MAG: LysE family transporter [Alphaproteobacteria bacterium]|nr:LysE family transporter [Alphaproteobacteria bacterium]
MALAAAFATIVLVNVVAWITPGPNMIAVMSATLAHGRRAGLVTGLGLATAATLWALFAVAGVKALFETFPQAVLWLRLIGAAYLIWLGVQALRQAVDGAGKGLDAGAAEPSGGARRAFLRGFLVSATNPKAALFFGSVLTAVLPADPSAAVLAAVVALCGGLAVLFHTITATLVAAGPVRRALARVQRWTAAAFGALFIGLGASVAVDALRAR